MEVEEYLKANVNYAAAKQQIDGMTARVGD